MYCAHEACQIIPINELEQLLEQLEKTASPLNLEFLLFRWPHSDQLFDLLY